MSQLLTVIVSQTLIKSPQEASKTVDIDVLHQKSAYSGVSYV